MSKGLRLLRGKGATLNQVRVLAFLLANHPREVYGREARLAFPGAMTDATVYVMLHSLEEAGWLTSRMEDAPATEPERPRKRLYRLTPTGKELAATEVRDALDPILSLLG